LSLFSGKREIMALAVKCKNAGQGCGWRGTVGTSEKHVATCEFALVPCLNNCEYLMNRIRYFRRKNLARHLTECPNREYECGSCGEKGTYADIAQVHNEICKKKIVPCPNEDCTNTIQRQDVQKHLEVCKFTKVACKYARLGCDVKRKRKDILTHEKEDTLHLHMALDKVVTMEEEIDSLKSRLLLPLTFKVGFFPEKGGVTLSPSFYTTPNGYLMDIKVYPIGNGDAEGTHVSVFARVLEGKSDLAICRERHYHTAESAKR
jgi:hypothetical protein